MLSRTGPAQLSIDRRPEVHTALTHSPTHTHTRSPRPPRLPVPRGAMPRLCFAALPTDRDENVSRRGGGGATAGRRRRRLGRAAGQGWRRGCGAARHGRRESRGLAAESPEPARLADAAPLARPRRRPSKQRWRGETVARSGGLRPSASKPAGLRQPPPVSPRRMERRRTREWRWL